jgi:RNA polymerase sigma factor (sigma-70 family)
MRSLVQYLRRLLPHGAGSVPDDADLLRRFGGHRDEAAFEVLVWRHGPMVLGVCRRLLHREQDAEDAFQATFLALARQAGRIGRGEAVAGWLYRVAYRTARRARARLAGRAAYETTAPDVDRATEPRDELVWRDLRPLLDEEVNRLPEKYRRPVILCYLEGRTNAEAASELRLSRGTVATRLAWARDRLRIRLTRRGVALSGAALAVFLGRQAAEAALAAPQTAATVRAAVSFAAGPVSTNAAALAEGVLQSMSGSKRKIVALVLAGLTALASGAGVLGYRAFTADRTPSGEGKPAPQQATEVVRGRVVDRDTGAGVAGVELWVMQALEGGAVSLSARVVTDAEGRYTARVRPGKVTVQVMGSPHSHLRPSEMLPVTGVSGDTEYETIRLRRSAAVEGTVVDDRGRAVPGASVWTIQPRGMMLPSDTAWAGDREGRFTVRGVPREDTVPLRARTDDAVTATPALVVPDEVTAPVRLVVSPKHAFRVRGTVADGSGRPVPGAVVDIEWGFRFASRQQDAEGSASRLEQHVTGADGRFASKALWPGDQYRVRVTAPGFDTSETPWVAGEPGGVHDFARIALARAQGVVSGRVVDSTGRPVAGVRVFNSGDGPEPVSTSSDADGRFRLGGLHDGLVYVFAEKAGCRFTGMPVQAGAQVTLRLLTSSEPVPPWGDRRAGRLKPEEERQLARRLLQELWELPPERREALEAAVLPALARLDPAEALRQSAASGGRQDHLVRAAIARQAAGKDVDDALAVLVPAPPEPAWLTLRELANRYAAADPARALRFTEEAVVRARALDQPARCVALADAGELLRRLGKSAQGRAVVEEAAVHAEKLGTEGVQELARARIAAALAPFDRPRAERLLGPLANAKAIDRYRSDVAAAAGDAAGVSTGRGKLRLAYRRAADNPDEAVRIAESIREVPDRVEALGWVAVALAPSDRKRAWQLIDRALDLCLRQPDAFARLEQHGGVGVLAARVAGQAAAVGYSDMESAVYRVLATRPTVRTRSPAQVAEALVAMALVLATFDPPAARALLEAVGPRSELVGTASAGVRRASWLEAWALVDARQFADRFEQELAAWSARPGADPAGTTLTRSVNVLTVAPDARAEYVLRNFKAFWFPGED